MNSMLFQEIPGLNERDRSIAEVVARIALHVDVEPTLATAAGFGEQHLGPLKNAVARFERQLSEQSPTLSSLLASTTKSKCCT